jgi:hypothetical protein
MIIESVIDKLEYYVIKDKAIPSSVTGEVFLISIFKALHVSVLRDRHQSDIDTFWKPLLQ